MAWKIEYDQRARQGFKKLDPQTKKLIQEYIDTRIAGGGDPREFGKPLRGNKSGLWRYRVDKYRILCQIRDEVMVVLVIQVGKRDRVYED